jgi:hypothetical protein
VAIDTVRTRTVHASSGATPLYAAAAPMAATAGIAPLALALGNGPSLPLACLAAGVMLLAVAARSARPTGLVATFSYGAVTVGLAAAFGAVLSNTGVPWLVGAAVGIAVVGLLGYRSSVVPARALAVLVGLEVLALVLFDIAVLAEQGLSALPQQSLSPNTVGKGGAIGSGLALLFALSCFLGISPGLASGRARKRYTVVVVATGFLAVTSWILVGSIATGQTAGLAGYEGANLVPALAGSYVGAGFADAMTVLLCASLLTLMLATHRAAVHAATPAFVASRVSLVLTGVAVAVLTAGAVAGLDPYLTIAAWLTGLGALGSWILGLAGSYGYHVAPGSAIR